MINFIEMIPKEFQTGNSQPLYDSELIEALSVVSTSKSFLKAAAPADAVAGAALSSSIKEAATLVNQTESRANVVSKLERLKVGYAPPVTLEQLSRSELVELRTSGRMPIRTMSLSRITSAAMMNELNQFISDYKNKYPEPVGYASIKSKLASDISKLRGLVEKIRASLGSNVSETAQLAQPIPKKNPKKLPISKPKGRKK